MTGRLANVALRVVVPLAAVSGLGLFLVGSGPVLAVAVLHGLVGLAVVVLVPWKSVVVRRGLRRARGPRRATSLTLAAVVVVALVTGVAHLLGVLAAGPALPTLSVHVGAGVAAAVLTLVHARHRRARARRSDLSRRTVLRLGVLATAAGVLDAGVRTAGAWTVPRGTRRATGSFRLASSSVAAVPATSWLLDTVPAVDPRSWRLTVTAGGASRDWSLADLARWDDRQTAVLDCTGGWWTEQEWSGVRLARLLPPGTRGSVEVTSATGYSRRLPVTADLLLATAVGGVPLSAGHGAPARLVVPGRRGYHWVKWVVRVEHDDRPWWDPATAAPQLSRRRRGSRYAPVVTPTAAEPDRGSSARRAPNPPRASVAQVPSLTRDLFEGAVAGAAGTTASNAATYLDMALRARPASSTPQQTVERGAQLLRVPLPPGEEERQAREGSAPRARSLSRARGHHPPPAPAPRSDRGPGRHASLDQISAGGGR